MLLAMAKLRFSFMFLLFIVIKCESVNVDTISSDVRFKNVDRTIDISSQLVKKSLKLTLEDTGGTPVKKFLMAVESSAKNNVAFVGAKDSSNKDLRLVETTVSGYDYVKFWRVELKDAVNLGSTSQIALESVLSKAPLPFPTAISRYDYQQDHHSAPARVRSYKALLPVSASDVYYRDTNGNISISIMKVKKDSVELDLRPRYPLFGGWRTHYTLGYNFPSYEYLYQSGNDYLLKMRVIDHIYVDMQVDEMVTKDYLA